jgi:hypothetical protein
MPETLTWDDGEVLVLPDETSERAARWTQKLIDLCLQYEDQPELIERVLEALLIEERQQKLLNVERALVKEF